ncbi:MAG: tRNA-(ms[2]io[6]A)-hydroxylase [Candidatus Sericytochromatia bacterium]|nr:tRNA-(ms[2]io[6]A)-hydroxylase [Candidatus Tanganyikabacteria bacterium]
MVLPHERLGLLAPTRPEWVAAACADTATLLADHAHCEKKAAATALSLISRHPEDARLVESMLHLAQEELGHFQRLFAVLRARRIPLPRDEADPYVNALLSLVRRDPAVNLLDRLLVLSMVEARSCERFLLLAERLEDPDLARLYADLARSEEGHARLFVQLAERYVSNSAVAARLDEFRRHEAEIVARLPDLPRMHG